jgi:hypothetical protein
MTYFISSEYETLQDVSKKWETEHSDETSCLTAQALRDFLRETDCICNAFKDDLLSLDKAMLAPHTKKGGALSRDRWPNQVTLPNLLRQTEDFWKVSRQCAFAFLGAAPWALALSKGEFNNWANIGRGILKNHDDSIELCLAYFETSPELIKRGSFHFIAGWVEHILAIASFSPETSLSFFLATPAFVSADRAFHLRQWAEKVRQILATGKGREAAAVAFIESSTRIVQKITFKELISWGTIGVRIAAISPDLALSYFSEPSEDISSLYNIEIIKFLSLTSRLVDANLNRAMDFYQRCPVDLASINPNLREQVLDVSLKLAAERPENINDIFSDIVSSLRPLFFPIQEKVMESESAIGKVSLAASRAYFKGIGYVLNEIPDLFLSHWIEKGLVILAESEEAGIAYFSLNSGESRSELIKWKETVLLERHKQALSIFAHALSGRQLILKQRRGKAGGERATRRRGPAMDSKTISLPAFIAEEPDRKGNLGLYKVSIAHQAGYITFNTFGPSFGKIASLLEAFPLNLLARDIFFIIEDGRIDYLLRREYRGLRPEIDQTVAACMDRRPFPSGDPLAEALEILLRLSQGYPYEKWISQGMQDWTNRLQEAMDGFFENAQGVWDSFQKAAELYDSFSRLAEEGIYVPIAPMPFHERPILDFFAGGNRAEGRLEDIDGNETGTDEAIHTMNEQDIKRLLEKMKDPKLFQEPEKDVAGERFFLSDIDALAPVDAIDSPKEDWTGNKRTSAVSPLRHVSSEGPFYYDEWDYKKRAYRRKWCALWEKPVPENDLGLFDKIYDNYSDLILSVKKQFQRIRPEVLDIVRRVEWGSEIDFNAMIQSVVDRKAGNSPSGRIFTRMEKKVRRISTVLLVDMSASTDRLVTLVNPHGNSPRQPCEKALQGPTAVMDPQKKKIIDVEIEGLVVITEALQSLGDDYAIFGFSGYGREQVDFYVIKDFDDHYCEGIKSRICGIQPQKGTRMGPAIRHAVKKLNQVESDYRLLVLLSDGFPQDINYGEDRSSKDYGLHDTMMALAEARKSGIRPFCITVDLAGDDYLRKMWDPGCYLVVKDVYSLPEVLPRVVESLVL